MAPRKGSHVAKIVGEQVNAALADTAEDLAFTGVDPKALAAGFTIQNKTAEILTVRRKGATSGIDLQLNETYERDMVAFKDGAGNALWEVISTVTTTDYAAVFWEYN